MSDQDFNIKVVTTADTTGLRQTSAEFDEIKRKATEASAAANRQAADAEAKWASSPLNPKNRAAGGAAPAAEAGGGAGLTGTYVGIGTIVTLLTVAVNKWKDFNDELALTQERAQAAIQKSRELGLEVADMMDAMKSVERINTEPLEVSFSRLTQDVTRLKTQIQDAFGAGRYEDVKKYAAQLGVVESQLRGVTSQLNQQAAAAERSRQATQSELEKRVPGLAGQQPIQQADAQTQRILQNEQAAAQARAEGRDKDAEMFQKSADQYKASATPQQLEDLQRIHDLQDKLKPAAAPTYQPLSPEEFARQNEAANAEAGRVPTSDEMRQHQLDNQASRYQGIQETRSDVQSASKSDN